MSDKKERQKKALGYLKKYDQLLDEDRRMTGEQLAFYAKRLAGFDWSVLQMALDNIYAELGRRTAPTVNQIIEAYINVGREWDRRQKEAEEKDKRGIEEMIATTDSKDPKNKKVSAKVRELIRDMPDITRQEFNDRMTDLVHLSGAPSPLPLYSQHLEMNIDKAKAKGLPR